MTRNVKNRVHYRVFLTVTLTYINVVITTYIRVRVRVG